MGQIDKKFVGSLPHHSNEILNALRLTIILRIHGRLHILDISMSISIFKDWHVIPPRQHTIICGKYTETI